MKSPRVGSVESYIVYSIQSHKHSALIRSLCSTYPFHTVGRRELAEVTATEDGHVLRVGELVDIRSRAEVLFACSLSRRVEAGAGRCSRRGTAYARGSLDGLRARRAWGASSRETLGVVGVALDTG